MESQPHTSDLTIPEDRASAPQGCRMGPGGAHPAASGRVPAPRRRRRAAEGMRVAILMGLLAAAGTVHAGAVAVSPMAVYLDQRTRTGTLTLYNPGSLPEEIEISFGFGYPTSDEEGNVGVEVVDTAPPDEPSALAWLRAFPRRLVLEPGQRQVVRIMVEPPPGIEEGEYWARALVRARGGQPPIEERQGDVSVQIHVETVVVAAVNYRHGAVNTGLEVLDIGTRLEEGSAVALVDLARTGNAAFLGRLRGELLDANGVVVGEAEDVLAVYRTIRRRVEIPVPEGAAGPFRIRLLMDTRRDDLPPGGVLPFQPLERVVEVR